MMKLISIIAIIFGMTASSCALSTTLHPVKMIEYFDYECPHCHHMQPILNALAHNNPDLKITYRAVPLLNQKSWLVAEGALAAKEQGSYRAMHEFLMMLPYAPGQSDVVFEAARLHLTSKVFLRVVNSISIKNRLTHNLHELSQYNDQGVFQLPTLVIVRDHHMSVLKGEVSYLQLQQLIQGE